MNRLEFMSALESALQDITEDERSEAIQYYNDYLNDAGVESEQEVMEALGTPEELADSIRSGMEGKNGEFTENGYVIDDKAAKSSEDSRVQKTTPDERKEKKNSSSGWKILSIILLCILVGPVVLPIAATVLGVLFALFIALGSVCVALVAAGIALLIAGVVLAGYGIVQLFVSPAVGLLLTGSGFLMAAIGALFCLFFGWMFCLVVPVFFKWLVNLCRRIFHREKGAKQA